MNWQRKIIFFVKALIHPKTWLPSVFWWVGIYSVCDILLSYWCWKDCACYHPYGDEWLLTMYLLRVIATNC